MTKSAVKTDPFKTCEILMDKRMKLGSLEITPNSSKVILWFSFLQNLALLIHIVGFGKLGFLELFFALLSPNVFFVFLRIERPVIFAMVVNVLLIVMPLVYYLRPVIEKKWRRKFNTPRLYDLIVNKSQLFGYFNYILIPILFLPFCEMNLFLNICYGAGIVTDPNDDFSFRIINAISCSDRLITALRIVTIVSVISLFIHLTLLINFVLSRESSEANSLTNDNRAVDWVNVARKVSLSLFLVPELLHTNVIEFSIIAIVIVMNVIHMAILLTRFTYYNQSVFRQAAALTLTELIVTVYFTINLIMMRIGAIEEIDQFYIPLVCIVGYIFSSAVVDRAVRSCMGPFRLTENITWFIRRARMMYFYMKAVSNGISIIPKLDQDSLEDQILSYFRNHFLSCQSTSCICLRIKCNEEIHDLEIFKKVDYSEDLGSPDGVITVTAKLFYLKNFIWSKIKELQAINPVNKDLLFELLKFEVFEMKNFIRASEIIRVLDKRELSTRDDFELSYIRMVTKHYYDFNFNHRIKERRFYNLEKFVDIQNSVLEIEDIIYASLLSFYKTFFYLVG
jgi:hypothetical protein